MPAPAHAAQHDPRTQLLHLLARLSFQLGDFQLSSGARSDYYIDCRITTLHAEGARLTGLALLDLLEAHHLKPAAVGGLTLGADPVVSALSIASAQRAHSDSAQSLIHGFLVRKAEKAHGAKRRVEGYLEAGARVLIVDDVCTTGASTVEAIEATRAAGMQVLGAVCLIERSVDSGSTSGSKKTAGRFAVEHALASAPFLSLFTAEQVRTAHIAQMPL